MALDYSKFASSDDQHALFDTAPFDMAGARKKMIARLDRAKKQFLGEASMKGGSDFERGHHNQIKYRPSLNGHAIKLPNMKDDYFPTNSDSFPGLIDAIRQDVEDAKFDDQLEAMPPAAGQQGKAARATTSPGKGSGTRNTSPQSALNIGVAARRRAANPPSFDDIRKSYVDAGSDPAMVDKAIEKRKAAEEA